MKVYYAQPSGFILSAFCFSIAMMLGQIFDKWIYYGNISPSAGLVITMLFVATGTLYLCAGVGIIETERAP
jgi:hypothetical protein